MVYDLLLQKAHLLLIEVIERPLVGKLKGIYADRVICIDSRLETKTEKACTLVEEIGHHETSAGDILDQNTVEKRKQEKRAKNWGYEELVPLSAFLLGHEAGVRNIYEFAELIGVTDDFLINAIDHYWEVYGPCTVYKPGNDEYIIYFDPVAVIKIFK
ncbi:ImmA/IrrE family metallo-endopeptidase [Paenibacillus sp. FSL L8-0708]|uniref:ImmA/IrrE family metallo-endopeptidase n=1 Tax=Paenibacillus sp. FSL L8-0708 TaxID=2975311 RepID=UPI0030F78BB5